MVLLTTIMLAVSAFGDFGFYRDVEGVDNQEIKSKIFRIYTPAGQYSSLPLANKSLLLDGSKELHDAGQLDSIQYKAILFQLDYCEFHGMDPCLLFLDIIQGTAFTAGEHGTIWTAFHNVTGAVINSVGKLMVEHNATDSKSVVSFMQQGQFPVYLVDEYGDVVVEPSIDESTWAQGLEFPVENIKEYFEGEQPSAERDFAKFKVPSLQVSPLPVATETQVGENIFLGGYPSSTFNRKAEYGALDSDGKSFYFGKGTLLDVDGFYKRQNYLSPILSYHRHRRTKQIMTTADGFSGHSGSPFFNERGEVIGIFVEYLPSQNPTPETNTSYGPRFSHIYELLVAHQYL